MKHVIKFVMVCLLIGCSSNENNNMSVSDDTTEEVYEGIPSNAYEVADNEDYAVFLNDEATGDSIDGLPPIKQVSLWTYEKNKKVVKKILLSHPQEDGSWFTMEHAVTVPLDSIPTISRVVCLSWEGEPLKLLVEGCSDYRNVQSFVIDINADSAICLPTNSGLVGISEEDGLLVMQSYAYYEEGGRYNLIEAFDDKGNRIASMEAKIQ